MAPAYSRPLSRRVVLGTAGSAAGVALLVGDGAAQTTKPRVKLRLLETSDLHMFVVDWDYYRAKTDPTVGFAKVATHIRTARAESVNTLLFDNGDFLQGNPLADFIAAGPAPSAQAPHPIIAIMSALGYDAVGLGNHEFNFGLDFLEATLKGAPFPFVCSNVTRAAGATFLAPSVVLDREVRDTNGATHTLRIGVVGFVPPQILSWDKSRLEGKLETSDIVLAARRVVPELRTRCDLVVALCHSGIRTGEWAEGGENAAFHLAGVPGIDVIMTGHSHRVFPGPDYAGLEGVDAVAGRLQGVPAVMPGFWGSHLGLVDLELTKGAGGWTVDAAHVETRAIAKREQGTVSSLVAADTTVAALIAPSHQAALAWVEQPVGAVDRPVHSYFVWAGYDPATALINAAQTWYARPLLQAAGYGELPLLSSAAPYRVGYTPDSFIDLPAGATSLRQAADLYIYSNNTVVAMKLTGAQIVEWLEFAARIFNTVDGAAPGPQALVAKGVPSYNFDTIAGLAYAIDVSKPPRYDAKGVLTAANRRIADVMYEGKPIDPAAEFVVLTNNYRADGGGNVPSLAGAKIVLRAPDTNRDALLAYFRANTTVAVPQVFPWRFAATGRPTSVSFDTGKAAGHRIADVPGLVLLGDGEPGYARVALQLA